MSEEANPDFKMRVKIGFNKFYMKKRMSLFLLNI